MIYVRGILLLTAVYIALTANLQPSNIVIGLVVAALVTLLLRPSVDRTLQWRFSPGGFVAFVRYALILTYDLIVSGIQVARLVLDPKLPIQQGVVAIPSDCETEVAQALSAHAITVTPGEMVVEISPDGTMFTHVLDATDAEEDIIRAQQMRVELLEKIAL